MLKIDAQVHIWYSDRPSRPWSPAYRQANRDRQSYLQHAGQTNSAAMAIEEMGEAGVDGALLAALGVYGASLDLEIDACATHPDLFRFVGVVDPAAADLADRLSAMTARGMVGLRIPEMRDAASILAGAFDPLLRVADDLALTLHLPAANAALPVIARRFPNIFIYLNHLGTGLAPPIVGFRPADPFAHIDAIAQLAALPNIGLKLTGAPALSRGPYPFRDVWAPLLRLIGAFGADRMSWGADYTRTAGLLSYREGVDYLAEIDGLATEQLEWLYAGTLLRRTRWHERTPRRG